MRGSLIRSQSTRTMQTRRFVCRKELVKCWWPPLQSLGLRVYPFTQSPQGRAIAKERFGPIIYDSGEFLEDDLGGLLLDGDTCVWVSIHETFTNIIIPSGYYLLYVAYGPPKTLFHSRRQKRLLKLVCTVMAQHGAENVVMKRSRTYYLLREDRSKFDKV